VALSALRRGSKIEAAIARLADLVAASHVAPAALSVGR
jgi:hypothetical protein